MPKQAATKRATKARAAKPLSIEVIDGRSKPLIQELLWRVDRLERQVRTLSELVRDHAEDADRLVKIVGEDHEALRRELLREHQDRLRVRKRVRLRVSKIGFSD
jgi:hypothetical protein